MTIEIAIVLSVASFVITLIKATSDIKRGNKQDTKEETSQIATVLAKLENISDGVADIKKEINTIKNDVREDHDRIIRVEESAKQAHKRIDECSK